MWTRSDALSQRTQSIADYLRAPDLGQFQDASQASSGAPRSFCSGCCRSSQKPSSRISSIRPEPEGQDQAHGAAYPGESLDNLLGGQTIRGLDNPINNGPFCNPVNLTDPSAGQVCSKPHDFDSVINDSDHSIHGNNIQFYGTFHPDQAAIESGQLKPSMNGFVHEQARLYPTVDQSVLDTQVLNYYTEDQVPVFTELVRNFITFNNWHSDIPADRSKQSRYVSGTSYGHGTNDAGFGKSTLPQRSIFQQLTETNHSWANYCTSGSGDSHYFSWTVNSGSTKFSKPINQFYQDAYLGRLPEFSYIDPSCCSVGTNSIHPSGLVSDGQILVKQIYDALRSGPQRDETLFIISFDETGGFHDHVPPPRAPRPDNLTYTEKTPDGGSYTFNFDRLGSRVPTFLISPWVDGGVVEKLGTNADGQQVSYSATSTLRTLGYLWDFEPFNPRVAAAPSFDHLIGTTKRVFTPETLVTPHAF
ncbi:hypothetical protein MPDQ_007696 [Monascus purpureus]|uniref:Phosphoesterase n=1 Tax=Monascus purpureus TaxID=5098 RepID=A0A507QRQ7_MONPU|nr:hypothetical protein MPDQ_007696 [Monascus purpureus]